MKKGFQTLYRAPKSDRWKGPAKETLRRKSDLHPYARVKEKRCQHREAVVFFMYDKASDRRKSVRRQLLKSYRRSTKVEENERRELSTERR